MKPVVMNLILLGVILNTSAQLLLKAGVMRLSDVDFVWSKILPLTYQIALSPFILMGLLFYVISVVVWLFVLSKVEVSLAYPMISLGYILNAITAYYLFDENLSLTRVAGILVILCGVYLIAKS